MYLVLCYYVDRDIKISRYLVQQRRASPSTNHRTGYSISGFKFRKSSELCVIYGYPEWTFHCKVWQKHLCWWGQRTTESHVSIMLTVWNHSQLQEIIIKLYASLVQGKVHHRFLEWSGSYQMLIVTQCWIKIFVNEANRKFENDYFCSLDFLWFHEHQYFIWYFWNTHIKGTQTQ